MNVFFIGNCILEQCLSAFWTPGIKNRYSFKNLAEHFGVEVNVGYKFIPGATLECHVNKRGEGNMHPIPIRFNGNLDSNIRAFRWGATVLEPLDRNLESDTHNALILRNSFIKNNCSKNKCYILAHYPKKRHGSDWEGVWLNTRNITNPKKIPDCSKQHFEDLCERLKEKDPQQQEVYIIPLGHVMYEIKKIIDRKELRSLTSIWDLYSHMDPNALYKPGIYLAMLTAFSTLCGVNPKGAPTQNLYLRKYRDCGGFSVSQEFAEVAWEVVWKIVTNNPYTGVTV